MELGIPGWFALLFRLPPTAPPATLLVTGALFPERVSAALQTALA
jgi:hypothetical protein